MSATASYRKGWCPTLTRPMESGDGWLVRLPIKHGLLHSAQATAIADIAIRHGNGHIDVTARGNLQLRGVTPGSYELLLQEVAALGFHEQAHHGHIITSPLTGIDPACHAEVAALAGALAEALSADARANTLPAKFLIVIDGGGLQSLRSLNADIYCRALEDGKQYAVVLGNRPQAAIIETTQLIIKLKEIIHTFMQVMQSAPEIRRMRDASATAFEDFLSSPVETPEIMHNIPALGFLPLTGTQGIAAIAATFGTMDHQSLKMLAQIAQTYGDGTLRLSPGRMLFLPAIATSHAEQVLAQANAADFITDDHDPRRAIETCPGAPACAHAQGDTRETALALSQVLPDWASTGKKIYISGCVKGCACPRPADIVLVANGNCYDMAFHATAAAPAIYSGLTREQIIPLLAQHKERLS